MAMNSEASKHAGSGGGELEKRVTTVEGRLGVIEKTMVTAEIFERELGAVRGEIGSLRYEMHTEIGALRDELHTGLAAMRHEMLVGFRAMRVEFAKLPFELVKWLIALSGIAAAIATAIYNLWFRW